MKHPRYVIELVPAAGNWRAPVERRLARFLKCALRAFGLRCVSAREVTRPERQPTAGGTGQANTEAQDSGNKSA